MKISKIYVYLMTKRKGTKQSQVLYRDQPNVL